MAYVNTDTLTDQFFVLYDEDYDEDYETNTSYEPDTNDDGFWDEF